MSGPGWRLEPHRCPSCSTMLDGATAPLEPDAFPEAGDVTICAYCLAVCRFVRGETGGPVLDLVLVPADDDVLVHPDVVRHLEALRSVGPWPRPAP